MNTTPAKIVLATDGSEQATRARQAAADISSKGEAKVHLVHVRTDLVSQSPQGSTMFDDSSGLPEQEASELLRKEAWEARVNGAEVAGEYLRGGKPAEEINALANELGADLVVVGSRGAGRLRRLVTGSVSEGVVHGTSCPVLIVRGGENAWPPARIVVGNDGSPTTGGADLLAAEIAGLLGTELVLVRAYENPPEPVGGWSNADRHELDEALCLRREELRARAQQLAETARCRPEIRLIETKPVSAMSLTARKEEEERTLLAVGGDQPGMLGRALLGSVSTDLLRAAQGPVLVVPSEDASVRRGKPGIRRSKRAEG